MNAVIRCKTRPNQGTIYNLDEFTTESYKLGIETLRSRISISIYEEGNQDFNMLKKSRFQYAKEIKI